MYYTYTPIVTHTITSLFLTEPKGWRHFIELLIKFLDGVAGLKHGIGNNAILLNPQSGEIRECPPPTPEYAISHLSMLFGFPEVVAKLLDYARGEYPLTVETKSLYPDHLHIVGTK